MSENTLEGWFLRDYERLKDENERLKEQMAAYEAKMDGYGITDLRRRTKAVMCEVTSAWTFSEYLLENGRYTVRQVEDFIAEDDAELVERFDGMTFGYYTAASIRETEFQYTLRIHETRTDWIGVTDGKKESKIIALADPDGGFCTGTWFPAECRDAMVPFVAGLLRDVLKDAIARYKKKMEAEE